MKQKNHTTPAWLVIPGMIIIVAIALIFTACQKTSTSVLPEKDAMQQATQLLEGQLLTGKLVNGGSEDGAVYLDYNDGQKGIIVQSIPGDPDLTIPSMENAEIITSTHGVVIKNTKDNSILLFPQNDTESIAKFNKLSSVLKKGNGKVPIAGTILLNFNS